MPRRHSPPPAPVPTSTADSRTPRIAKGLDASGMRHRADPPDSIARVSISRVGTRDRWLAAGLLFAAVAALTVVWNVNPSEHPQLPECPTLALFGVYCPGCGSTRATHHLLNGRIATAWRFNPLMVLVGAPLGIAYAAALASAAFTGRRPMWRPPARLAYALAIALLLYMAVRNIPGPGLDWLRPPEHLAPKPAGR